MASFGDGDVGDGGDHRPQYLCHHCNRHFFPFPPPLSSDDIICPNCLGDSFEELPQIPIAPIQNSPFSFSNMPPEIAAMFAAGGGLTSCDITLGPGIVTANDQFVGVTNPVSATFQHPVSDFGNGNFNQMLGQFILNSVVINGGAPPAAAGESGGNENFDSESESIDEDFD